MGQDCPGCIFVRRKESLCSSVLEYQLQLWLACSYHILLKLLQKFIWNDFCKGQSYCRKIYVLWSLVPRIQFSMLIHTSKLLWLQGSHMQTAWKSKFACLVAHQFHFRGSLRFSSLPHIHWCTFFSSGRWWSWIFLSLVFFCWLCFSLRLKCKESGIFSWCFCSQGDWNHFLQQIWCMRKWRNRKYQEKFDAF